MTAAEIRERFLSFFEERDHRRLPSASLVPSVHDPSVLLTTAGMQPLKPYFRGAEEPPSRRLTSCQKSFRTVDIEVVGTTKRHLTFFEMLGNFSVGDYFKQGAAEFAWELSTQGLGLDPENIWISVFGGDDELGLGPDEEAIECWRSIGIPDERIVQLGREDNFWQSGPAGPCGPCSELYLDRGLAFGDEEDRPGDDTERFLEFWNLVFMQYELHEDGSLTELPMKNIDTGLGVERMSAILQGVESVFETEVIRPVVELGEQLSGRSWGQDATTTRALGVLADHGRGGAFLMADGVVPSNEDRGYVLRRIMRRTMRQGHVLGIEGPFLPQLYERVVEVMGDVYPELRREWPTIERWARSEEESFGRTLEQGERLLSELIEQAKAEQTSWVSAGDAFRLHDTYGFPYEMTKELLAEEGLSVDDQGFEELMQQAREVSRSRGAHATAGDGADAHLKHEEVLRFARDAGFRTRFVGYETTEAETVLRVAQPANGWMLAKLDESPFYPEGGGQVSDSTWNRPTSALEEWCVPPQSSRETSSISTIRTQSPYFSPNSAIAPSRSASSRVVSIARTGWLSVTQPDTSRSTAASSSSLSRWPCVKSKRSLSGPTYEPAWRTWSPSSRRSAACRRCVAVWLRIVARRSVRSTTAFAVSPGPISPSKGSSASAWSSPRR